MLIKMFFCNVSPQGPAAGQDLASGTSRICLPLPLTHLLTINNPSGRPSCTSSLTTRSSAPWKMRFHAASLRVKLESSSSNTTFGSVKEPSAFGLFSHTFSLTTMYDFVREDSFRDRRERFKNATS